MASKRRVIQVKSAKEMNAELNKAIDSGEKVEIVWE